MTLHIYAAAWDSKEDSNNNKMVASVYLYRSARLNSAVVWPGSRWRALRRKVSISVSLSLTVARLLRAIT